MNEEEKKAIEFLKKKIKDWNTYMNREDKTYDDIILNLIEKQQKEIEELKNQNESISWLYHDVCKCLVDTVSKQKIKDKIKELTDKEQHVYYSDREMCYRLNTAVCVLEELLEESE